MLKSWMRDVTLAVQAKSGLSSALLACIMVALIAALAGLSFLCVAGFVWLSSQLGGMYAGLIMAGILLLIALIAAMAGLVARRRARERAILERASRARASWLLDPKILGVALQAGRALGWERIIPAVIVGFMAAQLARETRERKSKHAG